MFETAAFAGFATAAHLDYSAVPAVEDYRTGVRFLQAGDPSCELTRAPEWGYVSVSRSGERRSNVSLANILWTVLVVLVVLWLIGLVTRVGDGSPLIHLLIVVAIIILVYNLLVGRRTV